MATRPMVLICAAALSLGLATSVAAQKKGKPPASYPGTALFHCNGLSRLSSCPEPRTSDRIKGDGSNYRGLGSPEGGEGAHLRLNAGDTNLEMWIGIRNSLRVYLDFVAQDVTAPCRSNGNSYCGYPIAFPGDEIVIGSTYSEIQSSVINPNDPTNKGATLLDMPLDASWEARILIGFNDASGRLWNFNFSDTRNNGEPSPNGRNAQVTRVGSCRWIFTDGENGAAELSTLVREAGNRFRSFEGVYKTPFLIDFEATGCPGTFPAQ